MWEAYKSVYPEGPENRKKKKPYHGGELISPGPNDTWSLDAHCKLEKFGIQIYAAVDHYSRYTTFSYVGVSNRTNISVLLQYARHLLNTGKNQRPRALRGDCGAELIWTANLQYLMHCEQKGINLEQIPDTDNFTLPPLDECFFFGTSKKNSRVEGIWKQLNKSGGLLEWRVSFWPVLYTILFLR